MYKVAHIHLNKRGYAMIKTASLSLVLMSILTLATFRVAPPKAGVEKPRLLYFGATWCGPCGKMKKLFKDKDVKKELDKYDFIMYDYDRDRKVAERYGIRFLPTMIFKRGGKVIHRRVGGLNKGELLKILKEKSS